MNIQRTMTRVNNNINTFSTLDTTILIKAIMDDDVKYIKNNINRDNVDYIVDKKRKYTLLSLAIQFQRTAIIEYLLDMGAHTLIKTTNNEDAYDLSIKYQCKDVISYKLKESDKKISELEKNNKISEENIEYMSKSIDEANLKIKNLNNEKESLSSQIKKLDTTSQSLRIENSNLKSENNDLKSELSGLRSKWVYLSYQNKKLDTTSQSLRIENTNLKTENNVLKTENNDLNGLKRKYDDLQTSFNVLTKKLKKNDDKK